MEESLPKLEVTPISASRVKTFENCSWLYYSKYLLKVPEPTNEGALKGSICHNIFELLLNPKHKQKYKDIIKADSICGRESVAKLVRKYIVLYKLKQTDELFNHLDKMIMVGLKSDFFVKGGELVKAEYEFNILNEKPFYYIKGFIDKPFIKGSKIIIDDFKSSKKKFEGEDIESNLQGLIYSLACKKIWPHLKPEVRFIFLQFPEEPILPVTFEEDALKGFEYYLESIQKQLDSFSDKHAYSNFAADQPMPDTGEFKGKLLCGFNSKPGELKKDGTVKWGCPMKWSFHYYVVKKDGKIIKSALKKEDIKLNQGEEIEEVFYEGCPRHRNVADDMGSVKKEKAKDILDDF